MRDESKKIRSFIEIREMERHLSQLEIQKIDNKLEMLDKDHSDKTSEILDTELSYAEFSRTEFNPAMGAIFANFLNKLEREKIDLQSSISETESRREVEEECWISLNAQLSGLDQQLILSQKYLKKQTEKLADDLREQRLIFEGGKL